MAFPVPARASSAVLAQALSYSLARPGAAFTGALEAIAVGVLARRAPILRPGTALLADLGDFVPVCSLVSDTHLTSDGRTPAELGVDPTQWPFRDPPTTGALSAGIRRVLEHIRREAPRTVVWCGDEVDSGDHTEWAQWRAAVASVPGLAHRLVPGNHDVCFNRPFDDDPTLVRRAWRERAFQAHGPRLADYPVVDTIASDAGPVTVVLLDSCKHPSQHLLSNAIGRFGAVQLDELERILGDCRGPVLGIAHHHVWRDARFLQPDEWFNTALDADRLARILDAYRRRAPRNRVLVCHGHRHVLTTGQIGADLDVLGLPSTTLGDKAGRNVLDGILRYAVVGLRPDGSWAAALVPVGSVVSREPRPGS